MNIARAKAAPASEHAGDLRFDPCPSGTLEYGEIDVPVDHDRPDGPTLSIAVSRVPASGTARQYRGALLVNPGGPGTSGLDYAASKRAKMPESVRRSFDVVGFDPRGVGRSSGVDGGRMGGLFDPPAPEPVPRTPEQERGYLDGLRELATDCSHQVGDLVPHLTTAGTARDMDRIRQALGQPELNFLGISYGTALGATYAALFPARVGRMVLDSVVSPTGWHDFDLDQALAMIEQRDVLFDWIAAHPALGLGNERATVRTNYLRARRALANRPAAGDFGAAEFDRLVYRTLSRTERWEPFAHALGDHLRDDEQGSRLRSPAGIPDNRNYETVLRAVKCADSEPSSTDDVIAAVRELRAVDPQPILTGLESHASVFWPRSREPVRFGHPDMPPVLLTQSEHDPTTPHAGAKRTQAVLPGSRMVTLTDCYSHGAFASQRNEHLDTIAADYLVHGVVPDHDVRCAGPGLPDVLRGPCRKGLVLSLG